MVKFIAGGKGEGKTKKLIDLANEAQKTTEGHIVFIDDDNRHIYDLHHNIRFVDTRSFPLSNYREFVGFVYGIISQDNDIKNINEDGIGNILKTFDNEYMENLINKLENTSKLFDMDFILSVNSKSDELPAEAKERLL